MDKATDWDEIPLILSAADLRRHFPLSKQCSYAVANLLGIRLGKRLIVPKERLRVWLETGGADGRSAPLKPVEKPWGGHSIPSPANQLLERWEVKNDARTR